MIEIAADDHKVAFSDREESILNLHNSPARGNIIKFEVVMTIHANAIAPAQGKEAHVYGEGGIKGIDVRTLGVNLRFDYLKLISHTVW